MQVQAGPGLTTKTRTFCLNEYLTEIVDQLNETKREYEVSWDQRESVWINKVVTYQASKLMWGVMYIVVQPNLFAQRCSPHALPAKILLAHIQELAFLIKFSLR